MPRLSNDDLKPLEKSPIQAYFSNRYQLIDIIVWVLDQIGQADMTISTFSTSEEFVRRLWRLKKFSRILTCGLFCDLRAIRKTLALYHIMTNVFDSVRLCENHSKVVLLQNESHSVAIVTSQNQTRGDRYEAGVITTCPHTVNQLRRGFDAMMQHSVSINAIKPY